MSVAPGLQALIVTLRDGLIWLMLSVVLGVRTARALAQRGEDRGAGVGEQPAAEAPPPDGRAANPADAASHGA